MKIIDGKKLSKKILEECRKKIKKLPKKPGLAVILVGSNRASEIYVKKKEKACKEVGINFQKITYQKSSTKELSKKIKELNKDENINGILVQLPLPKNINADKIIKSVRPEKDVDGFLKKSKVIPPTIAGILELLKSTGKNLKNKSAIILANSKIFAEPLEKILKKENLKVKTLIKPSETFFDADIVITALGKPRFITKKQVKEGAIIIDVGITRVGKKILGDADFESLKDMRGFITPVPGGVGPMTVACLIKNLLTLFK